MCGILIVILLCQYCFAVNVTVRIGTLNNDLPCGGGRPYFTWKKKVGDTYHQIYDNEKYKNSNTYWLGIKNIECSDAGTYRCESNKPTPEEPVYLHVSTSDWWFCWSEWTSCSEMCTETRSRTCATLSCVGPDVDTRNCCSVDGRWSEWYNWGICSVTCGRGTRTRNRLCNNPPKHGTGLDCSGPGDERENCEQTSCGEWTDWNTWSDCPTTCGEAYKVRFRVCRHLNEIVNDCNGISYENQLCTVSPCTVIVGGDLTITCKFGGKVLWKKNNQYLIQSVNFTKTNVGYDDVGIYFCYSSPNSGSKITISVQGKPDVTMPKLSYSVSVGGSVILKCVVVSHPELGRLWWTKDSSASIDLSGNKYTGGTINNPSLNIQEIKEFDQGTYYCHAENSIGQSFGKTNVTTGYTPFVDILKDYYVTKTNQTITIDTVIRNANSASLLWYKDGQYISLRGDARYTDGNIDRPSLVIKNVQRNDKGEYKCQVQSSTFGSNEDSTTLKVVHTTVNETEYITKINETVTLNCDKQDALEVHWFHDKIKIVQEMYKYTGGVLDTPSLTIKSLTHKDRGIYTCETSYDGVKSRSGAITLNILDKPFFEFSQEYVHVTAGGDVMLPCTFYSYSAVKEVLWHKDGERFNLNAIKYNGSTTDQPSLTIYNLGIADSGRYSCFVTNDQGKSSSNIIELQITDGEKSLNVTSAVLGTFGGVLVIIVFIIIGLLIKKKRHHHRNENDNQYEITHQSTELETHAYDVRNPPHIYHNQSLGDTSHTSGLSANEKTITDMLHMYSANDFAKALCDKSSMKERIRKEFKAITSDKCLVREENDEAEETNFDIDCSSIGYMNTKSFVKRAEDETISVLTVVPSKDNIQQFWCMVDAFNVTKIVLLTKRKEKISDFFPITYEPTQTTSHMIEMTSSEKLEEDIVMFSLKLWNTAKRSEVHVTICKITSWQVNNKHPSVVSLSRLLNALTDRQPGVACFIGSEKIGYPICGCISVCFDVVCAIKGDKPFNILRMAAAIKRRLNLFRTIEEYELCYAVTEKYLETTHVYDIVD